MFKNEDWFRVLASEIMMTAITLGVFFGCRLWFGMDGKDAVIAAIIVIASITVISAIAVVVADMIDYIDIIAAVTSAASVAVTVAAATIVDVSLSHSSTAVVAIAVTAVIANVVADRHHELPKFLVFTSCVVESSVIFAAIYFSF